MLNADVTIVVGVMGAGKTFYCVQLCRMRPRVLTIDPKSTDPIRRPTRYEEPYNIAGAKFFDGSLAQYKEQLAIQLSRNCFTAVFRHDVPPQEVISLAETIGDLHVHFDELNYYRDNPEVIGPLVRMIQRSRALGISFSCCSQRPQELPRALTELATELVIFRVIGERSKDYLAGFDAGLDFDQITKLERGKYVRVRFGIK
jgi:hypothetical protein